MITMHASVKAIIVNGATQYLPMITARAAKGRMVGSKVPQGAAREFRTFTTQEAARQCAYESAQRAAAQYPAILAVA